MCRKETAEGGGQRASRIIGFPGICPRPSDLALFVAASVLLTFLLPAGFGKEFLTDKEIEKIQDAQEIDRRIKIYLEAASLRLRTAEDRLDGKESEPGDPFEFFTVEDMMDGYYQIMKSVMANLDGAFQKPGTDKEQLNKALKSLKSSTESAAKSLSSLKKIAEEKQKEDFWNRINQAIDITDGAHEGAEFGLSKIPDPKQQKKK